MLRMLRGFNFLLYVIFVLLTYHLNAQQNRSRLENQRKELNRQIEITVKNLEKTSKIKKQDAEKLAALQDKARMRSEKLSGIKSELNSISVKIEYNTNKITDHSAKIENINTACKKVFLLLCQNIATIRLIDLIFAPEQFMEQYIRHYYLKKLQNTYYLSASKLKKEQKQLSNELVTLKSEREEKRQKLILSKEHGGEISDEIKKQERKFRELSSKLSSLKKELSVLDAEKRKINNMIELLINEQIAASKNKSRSYKSAINR